MINFNHSQGSHGPETQSIVLNRLKAVKVAVYHAFVSRGICEKRNQQLLTYIDLVQYVIA